MTDREILFILNLRCDGLSCRETAAQFCANFYPISNGGVQGITKRVLDADAAHEDPTDNDASLGPHWLTDGLRAQTDRRLQC